MAGLFSKVTKFASSPQGRAAIAKAKAAANDPKNRQKFDDLVGKVKDRTGRPVPPARPESNAADTPTTPTPPTAPRPELDTKRPDPNGTRPPAD